MHVGGNGSMCTVMIDSFLRAHDIQGVKMTAVPSVQ